MMLAIAPMSKCRVQNLSTDLTCEWTLTRCFYLSPQVMLVYWLRDHGLGRYVRLEKDGSLILMGYGYTETVETIIDELDVSQL